MMKRRTHLSRARYALAGLVGLTLAAGACAEGGSAPSFLSIGTGGTGGIYYPIGGGLAARLSLADSARRYTAEVTGGSVENINRVMAGQIDLGFVLAVSAYEAFHGEGDYENPQPDLRVVAPLYPNLAHVLVREGGPIERFEDLRGKRVSVGSAGSGTEQVARQLLGSAGLTYDDVEERFLTFNESSSALRDGALDAAIISVGYPAAAVLEATTTGGARLLGLDPAQVDVLLQRFPYYSRGELPVGAYPGVERPVVTVAMSNWIVGMAALDDSVVEGVLNVLRDERVYLARVHEMADRIDLERLASAPIPLHPATERWLAGG